MAGLLARGSLLLADLPGMSRHSSGVLGRKLTAHSCGGSHGISPRSLLIIGSTPEGIERNEPSPPNLMELGSKGKDCDAAGDTSVQSFKKRRFLSLA
jgi:hypothetical protein